MEEAFLTGSVGSIDKTSKQQDDKAYDKEDTEMKNRIMVIHV